jgi:hypothetical protein
MINRATRDIHFLGGISSSRNIILDNMLILKARLNFLPLLNSQWVVWRVKGGREPGAANP